MKLIIIPIMLILLMSSVLAIEECLSRPTPNEVPCLVLLPSDSECSTINIEFFDNQNVSLKTETMQTYTTFLCQSTFTFTTLGTYSFNYTTGDTGSITVEDGNIMELLLYFAGALAFLLLFLAVWTKDSTLATLSGFTFIVLGIFIVKNGFDILTNFISDSIGLIIIGIGIYLIWDAVIVSLNNAEL